MYSFFNMFLYSQTFQYKDNVCRDCLYILCIYVMKIFNIRFAGRRSSNVKRLFIRFLIRKLFLQSSGIKMLLKYNFRILNQQTFLAYESRFFNKNLNFASVPGKTIKKKYKKNLITQSMLRRYPSVHIACPLATLSHASLH